MHYFEKYYKLKDLFCNGEKKFTLDNHEVIVSDYLFESPAVDILPGKSKYLCSKHNLIFEEKKSESLNTSEFDENFKQILFGDSDIKCNSQFKYTVIKPPSAEKFKSVIILLHGFNEKTWEKYYPWAVEVSYKLDRPVLLFPIAFHMNRADPIWNDKSLMRQVSKIRTLNRPTNTYSSFVNAAISTRIESNPQRLFWGGLQTYYDIIKLFNEIISGMHPDFCEGTNINILSYSIGSFFSLILMMANPENLLSDTKLFCFCGGATFDRMNSASKYILDNKATNAVNAYYQEQLNCNFENEPRLSHYLSDEHFEESYFKTMLSYYHFLERREARLKEIYFRVFGYALEKDFVVPPAEVLNTLKGKYRDIPIEVKILDYEYPYNHVNLFSPMPSYANLVDSAFNDFTDEAANFLI